MSVHLTLVTRENKLLYISGYYYYTPEFRNYINYKYTVLKESNDEGVFIHPFRTEHNQLWYFIKI